LLSCVSRATVALTTLSLISWLALAVLTEANYLTFPICGSATEDLTAAASAAAAASLQLKALTQPQLLLSSCMMVVAMMTPTLSGPMLHLWHRSLARHRWRAIGLFMMSYLLIWTTACAALSVLAWVAKSVVDSSTVLLSAGCCVAVLWGASSARRYCLRRCHLRPRLSIFGPRAVLDPLVFGLTSAWWCVATCWAWMVLPLYAPHYRIPLMALLSVIIVAERPEARRPAKPLWRRFGSIPGRRFAFAKTGRVLRLMSYATSAARRANYK
jgi:predicted metal-binding membrane protein